MLCYHIAAAAAVNIAIQTMRKAVTAQVAASAPAVSLENATVALAAEQSSRTQLITAIKAAWHRARPFEGIGLRLHRLFGVLRLEDVSTDDLRRVLAALTPYKTLPPVQPPRPVITCPTPLNACTKRQRKAGLDGWWFQRPASGLEAWNA